MDCCKLLILNAEDGNRTRTPLAGPRILSPVRLPVPPPRRSPLPTGYSSFGRIGRKNHNFERYVSKSDRVAKDFCVPTFVVEMVKGGKVSEVKFEASEQ